MRHNEYQLGLGRVLLFCDWCGRISVIFLGSIASGVMAGILAICAPFVISLRNFIAVA